jgi:hypothetical protein
VRIGATETVQIEDLTFHVSRARGPRKAYRDAILRTGFDVSQPAVDQFESSVKLDEAIEALVTGVVVRVDGLEDADGNAIPWTPDLLAELPYDVYQKLAQFITGGGRSEAEEGNAGTASP